MRREGVRREREEKGERGGEERRGEKQARAKGLEGRRNGG